MEAWQSIIRKVLALDYETGEDGKKQNFHLIDMEEEARDEFIASHNATILRTNAIEDDNMIESRPMKAPCPCGTHRTCPAGVALCLWREPSPVRDQTGYAWSYKVDGIFRGFLLQDKGVCRQRCL